MSDRDKPQYDPDHAGDLDDYWAASASFAEYRRERAAAIEARLGPVETEQQWLTALAGVLEQSDLRDFSDHYERLREISDAWPNAAARELMHKVLGGILDLRTLD